MGNLRNEREELPAGPLGVNSQHAEVHLLGVAVATDGVDFVGDVADVGAQAAGFDVVLGLAAVIENRLGVRQFLRIRQKGDKHLDVAGQTIVRHLVDRLPREARKRAKTDFWQGRSPSFAA